MKRLAGLALAALLAAATAAPLAAQVAVRAGVVHTMAGDPIESGVVVVRDGKIAAIGRQGEVQIPAGFRVLDAAVATPGLIDARSTVGFSGLLNQPHDQDQLDRSEAVQPELRAIDAYNPRDPLVEYLRSFGVTTVHTGHGPGALVSGQTLIAKTRGDTVERAVFVPSAMIAATLGAGATSGEAGKAPGTRAKAAALLRAELVKAAEYSRKRGAAEADQRPDRNLRLEALGRVLTREQPLLVTAERHHDILTALRIGREFDVRVVLDGAADAPLVLAELRAAGVPVLLHPAMVRPSGERENAGMATAALLRREGIAFALESGFEPYVPKTRVVLLEAAVAAGHGLPFRDALASITSDAARILGIDGRVGSLEPGKDGDLALYDGDPFEYTSHCIGVVVEGEVVSDSAH